MAKEDFKHENKSYNIQLKKKQQLFQKPFWCQVIEKFVVSFSFL